VRFIDYGDETLALLLAEPDRGKEVKITPHLPASITPALSDRKSRRNYARSFLHDLEYTLDLRDARASADLRLWLLRLKGETVAVPLWNDFVEIGPVNAGNTSLPIAYGTPVRSGAAWIILAPPAAGYDNPGTFEIVTVSNVTSTTLTLAAPGLALNWPAGTYAYPLMFGKLTERPELDASNTDEWVSGAIKIEENSSFSRRLTVFPGAIPTVGAGVPEFSTLPLWTITPSRVQMMDRTEARVRYRSIGFLRQQQQFVYPQSNARGATMEFQCRTRAEIAAVERFFTNRRGLVKPFMMPTFNGDLRLSQDTPVIGDLTKLPIEDSTYTDPDYALAHPGMPFLALVEPISGETNANQESNVEPLRVNVIDIDGVHVHTDIGVHLLRDTIVSFLQLVCFAESKLEWRYFADGSAIARLKVIELPDEYADPQPDLPEPLFLYRFTEKTPTPIISRFTNYEQAVTTTAVGPETWQPAPFEHKGITISLRPGETKTEIVSWGGDFTDNPLAKIMPFDLEGDLTVEIFEGDFNNAATPLRKRFAGDVMNLTKRGPDWTSECVWGGKMFKRKVPHFLVQKSDNFIQFTRPTKLDRAAYRYGATIESVAGKTIVCGPLAGSPDPTGTDDNFFGNGGFLEMGDGPTFCGRAITHSSVAAGHITLTLDRPLREEFGPGAIFNLWPGYDGSKAQCDVRYANGQYHGGHAFISDIGPQIKAAETKQAGAGKKG
jgi:hypothetical protein